MGRASLSALLGSVEPDPPTPTPEAPSPSAEPAVADPPKPTVKASRQASPRRASEVAEEPPAVAGPLYLRLVRKDTRLREDQLEALTRHTRRLNRKSPTGGARLTENSLIRIAVDLLLDRIDQAPAGDEQTIREALR